MNQYNHNPYSQNGQNGHHMFGRGAQSQEIDYGDIPENMDAEQMRAYLALESKLVMPNQKKRDSFEQQWNNGRQKYNPSQPQPNQVPPPPSQQPQTQQTVVSYQASPLSNMSYAQYTNQQNSGSQGRPDYVVQPQDTLSSAVYEDDDAIDRMSTVTVITNKSRGHRREHSFKKVPLQPHQIYNHQQMNRQNQPMLNEQNGHQQHQMPMNQMAGAPPLPQMGIMEKTTSNLTAQIAPQRTQLANQSSGDQSSGVIQSRNGEGKLVVKQLPYSKKTHVMVNVFVEITPDHVEHIIVYFNKHLSVEQFLDLLKMETNGGAFKDTEVDIFVADEDGDLDDDFPAPEMKAVIANLGLKNFYIKLKGADDEQRDDIRRSTTMNIERLPTEAEVNKMHSLNEDDEYDDEEEYEEEDGGCSCCIL